MRAMKLKAMIRPDRTLQVQLPDDVEEGLAEIIVLLPESQVDVPITPDLFSFIETLPPGHLSKAEIDANIDSEKSSWERV